MVANEANAILHHSQVSAEALEEEDKTVMSPVRYETVTAEQGCLTYGCIEDRLEYQCILVDDCDLQQYILFMFPLFVLCSRSDSVHLAQSNKGQRRDHLVAALVAGQVHAPPSTGAFGGRAVKVGQ